MTTGAVAARADGAEESCESHHWYIPSSVAEDHAFTGAPASSIGHPDDGGDASPRARIASCSRTEVNGKNRVAEHTAGLVIRDSLSGCTMRLPTSDVRSQYAEWTIPRCHNNSVGSPDTQLDGVPSQHASTQPIDVVGRPRKATAKKMDAALIIGGIIGLAYILAGVAVAKSYYRKKHGVPLKVVNGGTKLFVTPAYYLAWVWPLAFILPNLKEPELCRHTDHTRARQLT